MHAAVKIQDSEHGMYKKIKANNVAWSKGDLLFNTKSKLAHFKKYYKDKVVWPLISVWDTQLCFHNINHKSFNSHCIFIYTVFHLYINKKSIGTF